MIHFFKDLSIFFMRATVNGTVYETNATLFGIVYGTWSKKVIMMLLPDDNGELCYNPPLNKNQSLLIAEEGSADPGNVIQCQRLVDLRVR